MTIEKSLSTFISTHPIGLQTVEWSSLACEELVGMGSYGDVYRGSWQNTVVAIKVLRLKTLSSALAIEFAQETKMMAHCQFPHIIRLYAVCVEPGNYALVMEYMAKGSLYQVLHEPREKLTWPMRWKIALDIGKGVAYLHSQQIIHRDLKSLNILLDSTYRAKISDFGLAKIKLETNSTSTQPKQLLGTLRWRAPELFKRGTSTHISSDIYSYGIILWEIATRRLPFSETPDDILIKRLKEGHQEEIPIDCPGGYSELIGWCWKAPTERPTAEQVVEHLTQRQSTIQDEVRSWQLEKISQTTDDKASAQVYTLRLAGKSEIQKVITAYQHHAVPDYEIGHIEVIDNPTLEQAFVAQMSRLQQRDNNPAFIAKWRTEGVGSDEHIWRTATDDRFETLTKPYTDPDYPAVKLLPVWHGTKVTVLDSLFKTGYANLATTDCGFFGKGIYGAYEAEYAYRVYAKEGGALILNWVAIFSAYPVIDGDMPKLKEKGNYANHDAHFIPVVPQNPNNPQETAYYPCAKDQPHQYTEIVVFESAACLPRYLVHLSPIGISKNLASDAEQLYHIGRQFLTICDYPLAWQYFQRAANVDYPPAYLALGFLCDESPYKNNSTNAQLWYKKAAAQFNWFYENAEKGHADAQNGLGFCYQQGLGTICNLIKAATYYQLAADQGNAASQYNLALCYESGLGVQKDSAKAVYYYQLAANRDDRTAQFKLGICYQKGQGVEKNALTALTFFQNAADRGEVKAQFYLGKCYQNGEAGIPIETSKALHYYQLAAQQGHEGAKHQVKKFSQTFFSAPSSSSLTAPTQQNSTVHCTLQ